MPESATEPMSCGAISSEVGIISRELSPMSETLTALTRIYGSASPEYTVRVEKEAKSVRGLTGRLSSCCSQIGDLSFHKEKRMMKLEEAERHSTQKHERSAKELSTCKDELESLLQKSRPRPWASVIQKSVSFTDGAKVTAGEESKHSELVVATKAKSSNAVARIDSSNRSDSGGRSIAIRPTERSQPSPEVTSLLEFKAQTLVQDGKRSYNEKQYEKATEQFLEARNCIQNLPPESRSNFNPLGDTEYYLVSIKDKGQQASIQEKSDALLKFLQSIGVTQQVRPCKRATLQHSLSRSFVMLGDMEKALYYCNEALSSISGLRESMRKTDSTLCGC